MSFTATRKDKKGIVKEELVGVRPYKAYGIKNGIVTVYLEPLFNWKVLLDKFTVLPNYFYRLSTKAGLLLYRIFSSLRQENGKIKKMGWDQVEEIASILENIYNIKVQRLLQRNSTKQQKKLHRQERLSTIGTSYSLKQEVYDVPQKVVVLDDIITTGATLESCAKVLKEAGVKEVYGISLYSVD